MDLRKIFTHSTMQIIMIQFAFVIIGYHGIRASENSEEPITIKCKDKGVICLINKTCKYKCRNSCVKSPAVTRHPVYGTSVYQSDSPICKAAFHDLRLSKWDPDGGTVKIRSFIKSDCFLESSVRFGFSSYSIKYDSCSAFEFISPRVAEVMLDVVSVHSNYLYGENESHKQDCFVPSNTVLQNAEFDFYGNWSFSQNSIWDKITLNNFVKNTKIWNEIRAVGYQCIPSNTTLSIITSIAFRKDAYFLPEILTVTANRNENVILIMNETVKERSEYRTVWRKDNEILLHPDQGTRTKLSLNNVTEISSGIYSLEYTNSPETDKYGFVQLIVRSCPKEKYGKNCSRNCISCLNGGICHDITGECLCPPGFNGSHCENACKPGYVGKRCTIKCPDQDNTIQQLCKSLLICLPPPYGCSCASGFTGLQCDKVCADGYYGAGCLQQHRITHYKPGSCSKFFDSCECSNGWHGDSCNESYPVLVNAPSLLNVTKDSIIVSFKEWSNTTDLGSGSPAYYIIEYKEFGLENSTDSIYISAADGSKIFVVNITRVKPASHYVIKVIIVDETRNMQETDIKLLNVTTLCGVPASPPFDIELSVLNQNISIVWKVPSKEKWNCFEIDTIVKVWDSSSNIGSDYVTDKTFYSFFSSPYITWVVQVCISPKDGNVEDFVCAEAKNITSDGPSHSPSVKPKVVIRGTSLFFTWVLPLKYSRKMSHYIINYQDTNTGVSNSIILESKDAACKEEKFSYDCYELHNLVAGHEYKIKITAFMFSDDEKIEFKSFTVKLEVSSNSGIKIFAIFLPLVLAIVLIILVLYIKRHKKLSSSLKVKFFPYKVENEFAASNEALDEMDIIETESMSEDISNRIYVQDLLDYVKQNVLNNKIRKEFLSVPNGQIYPCSIAKLGENKPKNRYGNILPYDHSRVILNTIKDDAFSSYIHASYIHGYERVKKYIATQGPLECTVNDFWRMVWSEGTCKILMITNFVENGKAKCEKYWTDDSCQYGTIEVKLEDSQFYADFIIRTFTISNGKSSRDIKQFHFISWPDHGAPSSATPFVTYLKKARLYKPESEAPIIVHCSAGIGRTGTTILLDSMIDMGIHEKYVDLINHLCSMRKQRMNILENLDQYMFVHYALVDYFFFQDAEVKFSDFKTEYEKLQSIDNATGLAHIEKQFQILNTMPTGSIYKDTQAAYLSENQNKNRSMLILPPDRARPLLPSDSSGTDYINAVYVDSFSAKNAYVATQYPLPETVGDFWSMVYDLKSATVVLLQDINPSHQDTPQLWQPEGIETFGALKVESQSVAEKETFKVVNILINYNYEETCNRLSVNMVILKNWPFNSNLPAEPSIVLPTVLKVLSLQSETKHVITAVCSDGVTACGIICSILYICDQIKTEQIVDVTHAIKCVKANRQQFILDLDQFKFLYNLVKLYVDTHH